MKTVGKLSIFSTLVFCSLYLVEQLPTEDQGVSKFKNIAESTNNHSVAFVGSSRTNRGINPSVISSLIQTHRFLNLGISGSTFFSNYVITNYLIEQTSCEVIIFELSPIISNSPDFVHRLTNSLDIDLYSYSTDINGDDHGSNFRFKVETLNDIISKKIFIKQKVKHLLNVKSNDEFGYRQESENRIKTNASILKPQDLAVTSSAYDLSMYLQGIAQLIKKANSKNRSIRFMLPLTFRKETEKDIIIPLFHQIPDSLKVLYDERILEAVNRPELLLDANHFNSKGAKILTHEIARLIQEQKILSSLSPTR